MVGKGAARKKAATVGVYVPVVEESGKKAGKTSREQHTIPVLVDGGTEESGREKSLTEWRAELKARVDRLLRKQAEREKAADSEGIEVQLPARVAMTFANSLVSLTGVVEETARYFRPAIRDWLRVGHDAAIKSAEAELGGDLEEAKRLRILSDKISIELLGLTKGTNALSTVVSGALNGDGQARADHSKYNRAIDIYLQAMAAETKGEPDLALRLRLKAGKLIE